MAAAPLLDPLREPVTAFAGDCGQPVLLVDCNRDLSSHLARRLPGVT